MTDRIDPGPGWRLLNVGEVRPAGYEFWDGRGWIIGNVVGEIVQTSLVFLRARATEPLTIKSIATRATVKAAFPDGAMTSDSIACKTGLSGEMMQYVSDRWNLASKHLPTSGARYIMLEIHREGEP